MSRFGTFKVDSRTGELVQVAPPRLKEFPAMVVAREECDCPACAARAREVFCAAEEEAHTGVYL